jgi:hypothetical protein
MASGERGPRSGPAPLGEVSVSANDLAALLAEVVRQRSAAPDSRPSATRAEVISLTSSSIAFALAIGVAILVGIRNRNAPLEYRAAPESHDTRVASEARPTAPETSRGLTPLPPRFEPAAAAPAAPPVVAMLTARSPMVGASTDRCELGPSEVMWDATLTNAGSEPQGEFLYRVDDTSLRVVSRGFLRVPLRPGESRRITNAPRGYQWPAGARRCTFSITESFDTPARGHLLCRPMKSHAPSTSPHVPGAPAHVTCDSYRGE